MVPAIRWSVGAALAAALAAGCAPADDQAAAQAARELLQARDAIHRLRQDNLQLQATVDAQRRQIRTLRALGEKRLETLVHVERVTLGRHTGGVDLDDQPGHDGVRIYLELTDQRGSRIKSAGDVTVQLYDLAAQPGGNFLGEYRFEAADLHEHWAGGLFSYHYVFDCRWEVRPAHREITVRAAFVDYLTGRTFTAQGVCEVHPAGLGETSTAPAEADLPAGRQE